MAAFIRIAAIASGSNGNCYYFENEDDAILVDAGISCKQIHARMEKLGLDFGKIRGVFVTHEHADHVVGIDVLSRRHKIPVYLTKKTLASLYRPIAEEHTRIIHPGKDVVIGSILIEPFSKSHDAAEPCSFGVSSHGKHVSIITDVGHPCKNVIHHIQKSDATFIETNYDEQMLKTGRYPAVLKKRIAGTEGHLSNYQAGLLVLEHATPRLQHVFLSHLSANNNTPELAYHTFLALVSQRKDLNLNVITTSRYQESELVSLHQISH
jgi:phosphoribosyl 1,2-cyclic phosphodiesterase